ncbi:cytochrome P450 18a1 [Plutella xylostella]|uniref:cytochrome P450 18a1 n=1 Tax=Plutella xylostella TaxID=51655 RepID=UPI0020321E01|nr:cytochrome P450 18a1 [Plutella xylostella]
METTAFYLPITELLITVITALAVYYLLQTVKYYRSLPPGPYGLPFVGYLPWIVGSSAPHATYLDLSARHGAVVSLQLGSNLLACLGSTRLVRELFGRLDSVGRPHTPLNNLLEGRGIVLSEGDLWKQQRLFLTQKFRSLGVKYWEKQRFERFIMAEVAELSATLEKSAGAAVDPTDILGRHVHNVICQLMMGFRFKDGDPEFSRFNDKVAEGMRLYGAIHIGEHLPAYLKLPGKAAAIKAIQRNMRDVRSFHQQHVVRRRQQRDRASSGENREPEDLLDCYLDVLDGQDELEFQKTFPGLTKADAACQMVQVMNDLFSAGMETVRTTLVWALLLMLREPGVAARVRRDLARVVRPGAPVTMEHRKHLTYIEAVIFETLRRVSVVPLGTTHVNLTDWHVEGFRIPAGTHIIPLINKIHMDPDCFPDPLTFNPDRFLHHGVLQTPDNFIPFGLGRRKCLGEALARMELFLFFANVMNSFELELVKGDAMPGLDGVLGITHAPHPFRLRFISTAVADRDSTE